MLYMLLGGGGAPAAQGEGNAAGTQAATAPARK